MNKSPCSESSDIYQQYIAELLQDYLDKEVRIYLQCQKLCCLVYVMLYLP